MEDKCFLCETPIEKYQSIKLCTKCYSKIDRHKEEIKRVIGKLEFDYRFPR